MKALSKITALAAILAMAAACTDKPKAESEETKATNEIEEVVEKFNQNLPKAMANGDTLLSVTANSNAIVYRLAVKDSGLDTINRDRRRDSIIAKTDPVLKQKLIAADMDIVYRYVAQHDSLEIKIANADLKANADDEEKKDEE